MIFIIEGVDKSGKSTLAERVAKEFPGIMLKITDKPENDSEEERDKIKRHYLRIIDFLNNNVGINVILDRFYPSEICYSIKRGYEAGLDGFYSRLETELKKFDYLILFCHPGKKTIEDRITKEPDGYVSKKENLDILRRYENFFGEPKRLNVLKVDTSKNIEIIIKEIHEYIGHREN